jgi:hypothetical protein
LHDVEVGLAGVVGVNPALHAHLGGAPLPGFDAAAGDVLAGDIVGAPAQVLAVLALGKCAELALEITDVGVVDIAIDDVTDRVAIDLSPQLIGTGHHMGKIRAA